MLDDPYDHLVDADRASALWFGRRQRAIREVKLHADKQRRTQVSTAVTSQA
jgi:hypothetical protein